VTITTTGEGRFGWDRFFVWANFLKQGLGCCASWHGAEAMVESGFLEGGHGAVEGWVCSRLCSVLLRGAR